MKLTEQEKVVVSENHNLIFWYINSMGLDEEEWYDLIAIELCLAVKHHDPSRGSLSTYFKLRADGRYAKEMKKRQNKSRIPEEVEYIGDIHFQPVTDHTLEELEMQEWMSCEQREVVDLRMQGYSQTEIARMLGVSQSTVSIILKKVRADYELYRQADWTDTR